MDQTDGQASVKSAGREHLDRGEREVLRLIASGCPLAEILERLEEVIRSACGNAAVTIRLADSSPDSSPDFDRTPMDEPAGLPNIAGQREVLRRTVIGSDGAALATIHLPWNGGASHCDTPSLLESAAQLAALAIERQRQLDALGEAAQRQRLAFDQAAVGILELDGQGRFLRANRCFCRQFGFHENDLSGHEFRELLPPERIQPDLDGLSAVLEGDIADYRAEGRYLPHRGDPVWASITASAVRDGLGRAERLIVVTKDISDRKAAEEALRESEAYNRSLFESSPVGLALATLDGMIVDCNPAYTRLVGRSLEEVLTPGFRPRTVPGHEADERRATAELVETGWCQPFCQEYQHPDGRMVAVQCTARRVERGDAQFIVMSLEDITARRRAEEETRLMHRNLEQRVRERTAALEAANRELESFSYSISHDLRAPLRALDGFSHILLEEFGRQLGDKGGDHLRRIRAASQRMGELIDELIELAHITRRDLAPEPVDLSALAASLLQGLADGEAGRRTTWQVQPGVTAVGDRTLLSLALANLMKNAWKFTAYREEPRIEFLSEEARGAGMERIFHIRDNGAGFDMRYSAKLFTPFQRLHSDASLTGSGVGLAIVARIIARHGGRVWAEGEPGKGATFSFTLPQPPAPSP